MSYSHKQLTTGEFHKNMPKIFKVFLVIFLFIIVVAVIIDCGSDLYRLFCYKPVSWLFPLILYPLMPYDDNPLHVIYSIKDHTEKLSLSLCLSQSILIYFLSISLLSPYLSSTHNRIFKNISAIVLLCLCTNSGNTNCWCRTPTKHSIHSKVEKLL